MVLFVLKIVSWIKAGSMAFSPQYPLFLPLYLVHSRASVITSWMNEYGFHLPDATVSSWMAVGTYTPLVFQGLCTYSFNKYLMNESNPGLQNPCHLAPTCPCGIISCNSCSLAFSQFFEPLKLILTSTFAISLAAISSSWFPMASSFLPFRSHLKDHLLESCPEYPIHGVTLPLSITSSNSSFLHYIYNFWFFFIPPFLPFFLPACLPSLACFLIDRLSLSAKM